MDCLIQSFGAVGDGKTLNTKAIQNAIDACSLAGGGRVIVSDGVFMTGTIVLKSGVDLHIETGATLLGSPNCGKYDENSNFDIRPFPYNVILSGNIKDYGDYPDVPKKHVVCENLPRNRGCCLIFAEECENISITGGGRHTGCIRKRRGCTQLYVHGPCHDGHHNRDASRNPRQESHSVRLWQRRNAG